MGEVRQQANPVPSLHCRTVVTKLTKKAILVTTRGRSLPYPTGCSQVEKISRSMLPDIVYYRGRSPEQMGKASFCWKYATKTINPMVPSGLHIACACLCVCECVRVHCVSSLLISQHLQFTAQTSPGKS